MQIIFLLVQIHEMQGLDISPPQAGRIYMFVKTEGL